MRKVILLLVIAAQIGVLAAMAGKREWIIHHGKVIYLRTAPVDPRDPFRGDYVQLSYAFNQLPLSAFRGEVPARLAKGSRVYAALKPVGNDVYELDSLSMTAPAQGVFIQGRVSYLLRLGGIKQGHLGVEYGIEQLYVQQGQGREIEQRRGQRDDVQIPMEVAVSVGSDGSVQLASFRWSQLGVQLRTLPGRNPGGSSSVGGSGRSPVFELTVKNVSDKVQAIVDGPHHCLWQIEALPSGAETEPRFRLCDTSQWQQEQALELAPGQSHVMLVDSNLARWQAWGQGEVQGDSSEGPAAQAEWRSLIDLGAARRYRLVYRPGSAPGPLTANPHVWQGSLASPAFFSGGGVD